jgi:membrane protein YdbS with pleckstrin-like domain
MASDTINSEEIPKKRATHQARVRHLLRVAGAVLVMGIVFRMLWNWLGTPLFMFPPLTYFQAVSAVATAGALMMLFRWTWRRHQRRVPPPKAFTCCPDKPSGPTKDGIRDILYKAMVS